MNYINTVQTPSSDIELYVNSMEKVYNLQLEKINFMKMRLINFKTLLREENEISQKFLKMSEMMGSMYESSFHTQSNMSKNEQQENFNNFNDEDF
jgi:hypothetical protein